jgi:hypothetical protein
MASRSFINTGSFSRLLNEAIEAIRAQDVESARRTLCLGHLDRGDVEAALTSALEAWQIWDAYRP